MFWQVATDHVPTSLIEVEQALLHHRGLNDPLAAEAFFQPSSPLDLTAEEVGIDPLQLERAVQRIEQANRNQEKVLVFGDYDADGICATAILWEALHAAGVKAWPFIPHREKHGYGLSQPAVTEILAMAERPKLLITVDTGIVALSAIDQLQAAGVEVIVTDHHQPEASGYPAALAVVHTTQLCGSTVGWFLARAVHPSLATRWLDLAAIATVADQVPLLKANRSFVFHGLPALGRSKRVGLQQLLKLASVDPAQVTTATIHYALAPRINAMGRLAHGLEALRLLCTKDAQKAEGLALQISDTNVARQDMTQRWWKELQAQADEFSQHALIVVASPEYHEGVIGLLAGRLVETYSKPAIVMAVGPDKVKASARSIPQVNITDLIRLVRSDLLDVGGHPMAAGFSLEPAKVELVADQLRLLAKVHIKTEWLVPALPVEMVLDQGLDLSQLLALLERFQPFGQGNQEPILAWRAVRIQKLDRLGQQGQHLKLSLHWPESDQTLTALAWNKADQWTELAIGQTVDVAGALSWNEWRGRRTPQLTLKDINPASS